MKDKNFTTLNKFASVGKIVYIDADQKEQLIEILKKDAELLQRHRLIDYSLFLIEADYNEHDQ